MYKIFIIALFIMLLHLHGISLDPIYLDDCLALILF